LNFEEGVCRLLTTAQAAAYIGVTQKTLQNWRTQGKSPAYIRLGDGGPQGRCLYRLSDLDAWLAARTFRNTAEETVALRRGA
jgi:excisionase family DNA binding protein